MMQKIRKDNKGFTLVELLAVVVILAIIAGIAIPSIGGIIDNTKKDAHVANARMAISAAKLAAAGNPELQPASAGDTKTISIKELEDEGYLETMIDPDDQAGTGYVKDKAESSYSYVQVKKEGNQFVYSVYLNGTKREVKDGNNPVAETALERDKVIDKIS